MRKFRIILDIVMTCLFIVLMGYYVTDNTLHEILGTITFVLFILHNILNIKWYKSIFKGKHNFQRTFHIVINLLLFIAMIGMMISGIMISSDVFDFLNIKTPMFGRNLHIISTAWGFILMAIHVGFHITGIMNKLNTKMKNSTFEYVYYFITILLIGFGIYSFIALRLWEEMFLLTHFKFFDYEQSTILFFLKYVDLLIAIVLVIYFVLNIIKKLSNKNKIKN